MGKTGGSSWLNAVKKAFRSPSKDHEKRMSCRRREESGQQEEEEKRRGKRRWVFDKSLVSETTIQNSEATVVSADKEGTSADKCSSMAERDEQKRAIAVAMATAAAAKAAVTTAQAAVEIIRLTRPCSTMDSRDRGALKIQKAFRGYLARRALRALKGVVKLQALVRGHIVRQRANTTLHCMQALLRVQARVCHQRKSASEFHLASTMSTDTLRREAALASAFSKQIWPPSGEHYSSDNEGLGGTLRPRHRTIGRISCNTYEHRREQTKIVEVDAAQTYTYSAPLNQHSGGQQTHRPYSPSSVSTPGTQTRLVHHHSRGPDFSQHFHKHESHTSSPSLTGRMSVCLMEGSLSPGGFKLLRTVRAQSDSPRCLRKDQNMPASLTPTLRSGGYCYRTSLSGSPCPESQPNYMVATASANARARAHSTPRQRPWTPEREKKVTVSSGIGS